ncbi:MAG: acetyltransferase [Planctomycetes bacterium]|nr:acetyltransferase [Planctomycetota bacterium]
MKVLIVGAGGHGAMALECARSAGLEPIGVLDDDPALAGTRVLDVSVVGSIASAREHGAAGVVLGIGDNAIRSRIMIALAERGLALPVVVHARAMLSPSARIGAGSLIAAGAVIGTRTTIGSGCIINSGAIVEHDCVIADGVHVAPGAALAGRVVVGARTFIGLHASVIDGRRIGADVLIAAGAVVIGNVPASTRVAGVPAKPMTEQGADRRR